MFGRPRSLLFPLRSRLFLSRPIISFQKNEDHYEIYFDEEKTRIATFAWLRDHCRSSVNYNQRTHQRSIEVPIITTPVAHNIKANLLEVEWQDGHKSEYDLTWLKSNCTNDRSKFRPKIQPLLWDAKSAPWPVVHFSDYMASVDGLRKALEMIGKHGFCVVSRAPVSTENGTLVVANRLGPIMNNIYGMYWELAANSSKEKNTYSDSSFGSLSLSPHTDATYYTQAAGIQVFHCLQEADEGGENVLVDGFKVASDFKRAHIEGYEFFSKTPLEAEYVHDEPQEHYHNVDYVFKHHPLNDELLMQVRINAYDRAPHQMTLGEQRKFYKYFPLLLRETKSSDNMFVTRFRPGDVVLVDNWRVMHGRNSFEGKRIMSGCYIERDAYLSRARTLGLL